MKHSTSRIAATVAAAIVLVLGTSYMTSLAQSGFATGSLDLTASAHPTDVKPDVSESAFDVDSVWWRPLRADTTAVTSAVCDGCTGASKTLQVIYGIHPFGTSVDNAAVAWSSCVDCGATALSVQVVVLRGAREITANNRALSTNAACAACNTGALAYQLVVAGPNADRLSRTGLAELRAWVAEQARLLRAGAPAARLASARTTAGSPITTLEQLVNKDLGTTTKSADVDLSRP